MTAAEIMRASGLKLHEFSGARLEHKGYEVDTYSVKLEESVVEFGKRGDRVLFPVRKRK